jgi:hypothetical protein
MLKEKINGLIRPDAIGKPSEVAALFKLLANRSGGFPLLSRDPLHLTINLFLSRDDVFLFADLVKQK